MVVKKEEKKKEKSLYVILFKMIINFYKSLHG